MAERERKTKIGDTAVKTEEAEGEPKIGLQAHHDAAVKKVDDLLDEIDEVLESNAEDFVRSYVQKGGE